MGTDFPAFLRVTLTQALISHKRYSRTSAIRSSTQTITLTTMMMLKQILLGVLLLSTAAFGAHQDSPEEGFCCNPHCETPVFDRSDSEQFCRSKAGLFCLACGQKSEIMEFIKGLEDEDKPDVVSPPEPVRQRRNAVYLQAVPQAGGIGDKLRKQ